MKNRVRVSATFSFRGETFHPELVLDLDRFLTEGKGLADIYPMLAAANGIGGYSYEYEVLEATPLHFDHPEGLVADHLHEGQLDFAGLQQALADAHLRKQLEEIARKQLGIKKLEEIPGLEAALQSAWKLGRQG